MRVLTTPKLSSSLELAETAAEAALIYTEGYSVDLRMQSTKAASGWYDRKLFRQDKPSLGALLYDRRCGRPRLPLAQTRTTHSFLTIRVVRTDLLPPFHLASLGIRRLLHVCAFKLVLVMHVRCVLQIHIFPAAISHQSIISCMRLPNLSNPFHPHGPTTRPAPLRPSGGTAPTPWACLRRQSRLG